MSRREKSKIHKNISVLAQRSYPSKLTENNFFFVNIINSFGTSGKLNTYFLLGTV